MTIRALFVEVDELQNRMILSQRQLLQAELLKTIEVGSVVQVRACNRDHAMLRLARFIPVGRVAGVKLSSSTELEQTALLYHCSRRTLTPSRLHIPTSQWSAAHPNVTVVS